MSTQIITTLERCRQLTAHLGEDDIDGAALRAEIDAALSAARKLIGNGRPVFDAMEVHRRISGAIRSAGSCAAWARSLGISKSYGHEIHNGLRPASDAILASVGLVRKPAGRDMFLEI